MFEKNLQPAGRRNAPVVLSIYEVILIGDRFLADFVWSDDKLAGHPAVSGALCGGWASVALASRQYGVKVVKVKSISVHEVTVDDVVHVTIQVFGEHIYVQVCGQSVLTGLEVGRSSELTHALQTQARIG